MLMRILFQSTYVGIRIYQHGRRHQRCRTQTRPKNTKGRPSPEDILVDGPLERSENTEFFEGWELGPMLGKMADERQPLFDSREVISIGSIWSVRAGHAMPTADIGHTLKTSYGVTTA